MPCGATHVSHGSICSGCGACERGREHVASTSAARRWLEPVNVSPTIALQLQESCCKHMGRPHAACTMCRPSALEGCYVRMRSRRLSAGTIQLQPLHDHVIRCITDCCDMPGIAVGQQVMGARLGTATHVSHGSICSGCGACELVRVHASASTHAPRLVQPAEHLCRWNRGP